MYYSATFNKNDKNNYKNNFIVDFGLSVHVISNKDFFYTFKETKKLVLWGKATKKSIIGIRNVLIYFKDSNKKMLFKNCYYMLELGINIISNSVLEGDYYNITNKYNIYLRNGSNTISIGE